MPFERYLGRVIFLSAFKKRGKMFDKDEWTQKELFENTKILQSQNRQVILVDTVLKPIENMESMTYNPYEMNQMPIGTVFVFYCDTGKTTKERLAFYRKKLPNHECVSLRGGRGYWRPHYQLLDGNEENK
jgi:hypothetical protein